MRRHGFRRVGFRSVAEVFNAFEVARVVASRRDPLIFHCGSWFGPEVKQMDIATLNSLQIEIVELLSYENIEAHTRLIEKA